MAGVHVRGHKAAYMQAVYLLFAMVAALIRVVVHAVGLAFRGVGWGVQAIVARREQARQDQERLGLTASEVAGEGGSILQNARGDPAVAG